MEEFKTWERGIMRGGLVWELLVAPKFGAGVVRLTENFWATTAQVIPALLLAFVLERRAPRKRSKSRASQRLGLGAMALSATIVSVALSPSSPR